MSLYVQKEYYPSRGRGKRQKQLREDDYWWGVEGMNNAEQEKKPICLCNNQTMKEEEHKEYVRIT